VLIMQYKSGDIIFTQIGNDENAISAVTEGYKGARVNHMGVIVTNSQGIFVIEAFPPEVRLTSIAVFLRRSNDPVNGASRYIIARLNQDYQSLIPAAIAYGISMRNTPYDELYLTDEDKLYCSELVVDMFKEANNGKEFFPENPMNFRDTATGIIHPAWQAYYDYFGMEVPQGQPGSNPGDISKDDKISILVVNGPITGYDPTA
jgi:hypothetical protein